jgi:hypothetical protein
MSIQEQSNVRSVQKKLRGDRDSRQSDYGSDRNRSPLRKAALGHAW